MLVDYNANPYDIDARSITVQEVYDKVHKQLLKNLENRKISKSSYKSYIKS